MNIYIYFVIEGACVYQVINTLLVIVLIKINLVDLEEVVLKNYELRFCIVTFDKNSFKFSCSSNIVVYVYINLRAIEINSISFVVIIIFRILVENKIALIPQHFDLTLFISS